MRHLIAIAVLLLAAAPSLAQGAGELTRKADELERRAEALLDKGQRAAALELLAKAADHREQAREAQARARPKVTDRAKPGKKPKVRRKARSRRDGRSAAAVDAALARLDGAVAAGDMKTAAATARLLRTHLARWAKELDGREKELARRRTAPTTESLRRRMESLEAQIAALRSELKALD
jgi:hypothetical protein